MTMQVDIIPSEALCIIALAVAMACVVLVGLLKIIRDIES